MSIYQDPLLLNVFKNNLQTTIPGILPSLQPSMDLSNDFKGILLVNKPKGVTSFQLVAALRRRLGIKKIGHTGTLDPFATGVMVMLIGREFTKFSDLLLCQEKEYQATLKLGVSTDTYDCEGNITKQSDKIPSKEEVALAISRFQGKIQQIPPMFSAKKQKGKKLYELARKGIEVERAPVEITLQTTQLSYNYPYLNVHITCSKGTYIRSLGHDLGSLLGCGAHLEKLIRLRNGSFNLSSCIDGSLLFTDFLCKSSKT